MASSGEHARLTTVLKLTLGEGPHLHLHYRSIRAVRDYTPASEHQRVDNCM
jgi:hypothetical protein